MVRDDVENQINNIYPRRTVTLLVGLAEIIRRLYIVHVYFLLARASCNSAGHFFGPQPGKAV
jgi:hypothetical protein